MSDGSRFGPSVEQMRDMVVSANNRAERLALRIGAAVRALNTGQPYAAVIAILNGEVAE